jgi:hypothetical protein
MLQWLTKPDPQLSYSLLASIYFLFVLACALLFAVEAYEVSEAVSGWWMIPAPAAPALAWALWMRSRQRSSTASGKEA